MDPLLWQKRLRPFLTPLSWLYSRLAASRRMHWEAKNAPAFRSDCLCLSVGNIAWGGTGKTPLVDWILGWGESRGLRMAVLSRGYKAQPPELPLRVSDSHSPLEAGDEPLMLARQHPGVTVLVDPDRRRSGCWAEEQIHPDMFVLDDGFQHVKVRRDLDLVLFRPDDLADGWGRVIPAGAWREGPEALSRADAFLIKCTPEKFNALRPACERRLAEFRKPLFSFSLHSTELQRLGSEECRTAEQLPGPYAMATGVGDPVQVSETVSQFMGRSPERLLAFPDHHAYTQKDAATLEQLGIPIICTGKDAVKLCTLPLSNVWVLRVETVFGPALWTDSTFPQWLDAWVEQRRTA